jgi:pimeloyl-ACP methyl ester carboxylesterase
MSPAHVSRRRRGLTVLVVGLVLGGCSPFGNQTPPPIAAVSPAASASADTTTPAPVIPGAFVTTPARWTDCGSGFQCASLRLPRDYDDPSAGTLDVSLIRLPATDQTNRIGSLVVNPGGPGGSGIEFVRDGASSFPKAIRARFDIVGFDPRGVNSSSPVRCIDNLDGLADLDPSPDTPAELKALVDQAQAYAAACAQRNASLLPYLSTEAVVQDLDQIRIAVQDEKLTYLGFSYGTLIGSMYADRFPDRIRAMVLDGALDPSLTEVQLRTGQATAFEAELSRFLADCATNKKCAFYQGGKTRQAFDTLMAAIDKKPIPILRTAGRRKVGPGLAFSAVLGAMYDKSAWPSLAIALSYAKAGDGRLLVLISDPFRGRKPDGAYSNQSDAYFANTCLDFPVSTDLSDFSAMYASFKTIAPHFRAAAYNDLTCAFWPVAPERTPAPASGIGAPPIVVVGSTFDPATPYAWAQALASQLQSGVLVTRDGDGHTGYFVSGCVQDAADGYLTDLTVPKDGLVCEK